MRETHCVRKGVVPGKLIVDGIALIAVQISMLAVSGAVVLRRIG